MALKIGEIKERLAQTPVEERQAFIREFSQDERTGVKKIVDQAKKSLEKLEAEKVRSSKLLSFERKYYPDYEFIGGIDEVGRGPFAGPVVTACVILPKESPLLYINDSKKLSEGVREELYDQILKEAISVGFGIKEPEVIDSVNILQATYLAMQEAVASMDPKPDLLLVDAVTIPNISMKQVPIIHGDALSKTIGAASILAKVKRDHMMAAYDKVYPGYGFAKNKGYGTAEHIAALKKQGPCPIHRRSFIHDYI